ncbi:MAG: DUF3576 domain-containing protein [Marinibacterium sp.]
MTWQKLVVCLAAVALITGCSKNRNGPVETLPPAPDRDEAFNDTGSTIATLFDRPDNESVVQVNRYLWAASLDVLNFLPVESVDPFTGLIVTGYGRPPGGSRTYRATIHVSDPALDARSLNVSLQSKGGPVSAATARAVEDAILSRARQLRIADGKR